MESAISATYTAISFMHALNRDIMAGLLYLVLAILYLETSRHRRRAETPASGSSTAQPWDGRPVPGPVGERSLFER
jgi:hypothetical protein